MSEVAALRSKYPGLFPAGIELWFPPGWAVIVERMSAALVGKRVEIRSVREKYGWLIVQYREDTTDAQARAVIQVATDAAAVTCEQCGAPGVMRENEHGVVAVRCDEHADGAEPIVVKYAAVLGSNCG